MRRLLQACALVIAFVAMAGTPSTASAAPLRVRVRGASKISARGWREQTSGAQGTSGIDLVLSGTLNDDAGAAMPNTSVAIRVARETDPHDARVAQNLRAAHTCSRTTSGIRIGGTHDAPEVIATTDEAGRFCFRAPFDPDRYKATIVYAAPPGRPLVDAGEREITFDLSRRGLSLRFDPVPKILAIDTPRTTIEVVALHDDDESPRIATGLAVTLANELGDLATATTDASGRARFTLAGNKLGPPGAGELRATFIGNSDIAGATSVEEVERHIKVQIAVPAADRGELKPMTPEDGIAIAATVTSSIGAVAEGSVEAWIGDVIVGAAPVVNGSAKLTLTFATSSNEARVRLRYIPASPWYEPVGEPSITIPIKGPSILSKAPLLLAGLAVIAFFLVGRVSGPKVKAEPAPPKDLPFAEAKPKLEVLRRAERGEEGWSGRIIDAHDGTPIARARIWIDRGTFEGHTRLAAFETGPDGRFKLAGIGAVAGDETIHAEARLHARLSQGLPPPGEIQMAIVQRRRALLANLVAWAKRRGAPYDVKPEPTPGQVARHARNDPREANAGVWASAVEAAVFGPGEVDERREGAVDQLAPPDRPKPDAPP